MKLKLKRQSEKKRNLKLKTLKVATLANMVTCNGNLDVFIATTNGEMIAMAPNLASDEVLSSFLHQNFPSYKICSETNKLILTDKDTLKFITEFTNSTELTSKLAKTLDTTEVDATVRMFNHLKKHDVLIQPTGLNALLHQTQLWATAGGSAVHSFLVTGGSQVSGITGLPLVTTNPMLVLTIPTTGAIFFAGMERVCAGTPAGKAFGLLRDGCLLPLAFGQTLYNHLIAGPILGRVGIDAPLNLTSYLQFGAGIKGTDFRSARKLIGPATKLLKTFIENSKDLPTP